VGDLNGVVFQQS